jgi:hypothetical protein
MPAQPSGKRRRVAALGPLSRVFSEDPTEFAAAYASAEPYPHGVVSPLCALGEVKSTAASTSAQACPALEAVRDEVVTHLTSTFKETDLFKLYQTIDLANLDATQPLFHKVRDRLLPSSPSTPSPLSCFLVRTWTRTALCTSKFGTLHRESEGALRDKRCKGCAIVSSYYLSCTHAQPHTVDDPPDFVFPR